MRKRSTDISQIKLRIREELKLRLEEAASANDQSLNAEMCQRLAHSFEDEATALLQETLAGDKKNALLVALMSFALHLSKVTTKGETESDAVQQMQEATFAITGVVLGLPFQPMAMEDLIGYTKNKQKGLILADIVLRGHNLPGLIVEVGEHSDALSALATLMGVGKLAA